MDASGRLSLMFEVKSGKNFVQYGDPVQDQLMQCVADGEDTQELESPSNFVTVNLSDMTHENKGTKTTSEIRCVVLDDKGDKYVWKTLDANDEVVHLTVPQTEALETAYGKKRVRVQAAPYTFDLKKMVAKVKGEKEERTLTREWTHSAAYSRRSKMVADLAPVKASGTKATAPAAAAQPPAAANGKAASKRKKADANDAGDAGPSGGDAPVMKSMVLKTLAPVDPECPQGKDYHVYCEGDDVWDCMLNQTNIGHNNNKYYLIQLLEKDGGGGYAVWMRWGRVGFGGQNSFQACGSSVAGAMGIFMKKFQDKTKNHWHNRKSFAKVAGKYDLVKIDYAQDEPDAKKMRKDAEATKKEIKREECTLPGPVKELIEMICNIKAMESAVMEMQYDTKKSPLGKLTEEQIRSGYQALKHIDELIRAQKTGSELVEACSQFYTRIPHNFGMRPPTVIRSTAEVQQKLELLEALGDIQLALKLIGDESDADQRAHPTDLNYKALNCDLQPLQKSDKTFKLIDKYLSTTHGHTHTGYKLRLLDVFAVEKHGERDRFVDNGNRMLLWHGSRLTNWAGILGAGLKIAPPEAPATGYMFGKGIYFADMASKSANYCFANRGKPHGILLLSEVSLGTCNELLQSNYRADLLPKGKHSTKGVGRCAPESKTAVKLDDGVVVPVGPGKPVSIDGAYLQYNEFIVYNVAQVRMRYLLRVEFVY